MNDFNFDYNSQSLIDYFNVQPSVQKGRNNYGTAFYKRILYNLLYSVYDFKLPKEWKINFFRFWLFHYGSIGVIYTKEFGWICNPYSILELGLYYNPSKIQIYNRFLKDSKVGLVGINSGVVHCFDDYFGFDDIVTRFATKLSGIDKTFEINLANTNFAFFAEVDSKKKAETLQEAFSRATQGEPLIAINEKVLNGTDLKYLFPDSGRNFIADKLLTARRGVMNEFLTTIGIRNSNFEKRERLITSEIDENNDETSALVRIVFDNIKADFEAINNISGLGLDVKMRYEYLTDLMKGAGENEINTLGNR